MPAFRMIAALLALPLFSPAILSAHPAESTDTAPDHPRAVPLEIDQLDARQRAIIGLNEHSDGEPLPKRAQSNLFRVLVQHPELIEAYTPIGDWINRTPWGNEPGQISKRQKEMMILRIAWLYGGEYEWYRHFQPALSQGLSRAEIGDIRVGPTAPNWSDEDRLLLRAMDELVGDARLGDTTWAALISRYDQQRVMELITLVTHYHWVSMMTQTLDVRPEGEVEGFATIVAREKRGELRMAGNVAFVEGPAWRDGVLYFTDIPNNRIMKWDGQGRPQVHRSPSTFANGLTIDPQGRLLAVEDAGGLVRENLDGTVEQLATEFEGKPFNALNDLAIDTLGRIYFTDPGYNRGERATQRGADGTIVNGVYRRDPDGSVQRIIAHEVTTPNGIIVSPGDKYLWIAENSSGLGEHRRLLRYDLLSDGTPDFASKFVAFDWGTDRGPDGMTIDTQGNVYVAAGLDHPLPRRTSLVYKGGIYVFSQDGNLIDFIDIPTDPPSNVTFGGENNDTLYVTAGYQIWTFPTDKTGYRPLPSAD